MATPTAALGWLIAGSAAAIFFAVLFTLFCITDWISGLALGARRLHVSKRRRAQRDLASGGKL